MRWLGLLLTVLLTVASHAHGEENAAQRRVVLAPVDDDHLKTRIRAELELLGFEVIDAEEAPTDELLRQREAAFALVFTEQRQGYEVWLRDRVTNKTVIREVIESSSPRATALRAVELLRASLLELKAAHPLQSEIAAGTGLKKLAQKSLAPEAAPISHEDITPPAQPAPPRKEATERSRSWSYGDRAFSSERVASAVVEVGPIYALAGSGIGGGIGFEANASYFIFRYVRMGVVTNFVPRWDVSSDSGTVSLRSAQLGFVAGLHFRNPAGIFSAAGEIGLFGTWLHIQGEPVNDILRGFREDRFSAMPMVRAQLSFGVPPFPMRLGITSGIGVAAPATDIVVRDEVVATWGQPLMTLKLSLAWQFE